MRRIGWNIALALLAAVLWCPRGVAQTPITAQSDAPEEIVVTGEYPGPGMWKVTRPDDPEQHVLWIIGSPPPLPKKMKWKSADIEAAVRGSQELLFDARLEILPDKKVGFFRSLTLLPAALAARKNPDGAKLEDLLPADLYARWLVQKKKYLGNDRGVEQWRPTFAAGTLLRKAFDKAGLGERSDLRERLAEIAKKNKIKTTIPIIPVPVETKEIKTQLRQFAKEPLDDAECFATLLGMTEAIGDRDNIVARANAWATGDLESLERIPALPDPEAPCSAALFSSQVAKGVMSPDVVPRLGTIWLRSAEQSLAKNESTVAVISLARLTRPGGYIEALRGKGYRVEAPK